MLLSLSRKDDELRQLREYITDSEKRKKGSKAGGGGPKELLKAKKHLKDRERELMRLGEQLKVARMQTEEYRVKYEEVATGKKSLGGPTLTGSIVSTNGRPMTAGGNANAVS
jgi:hypothetical protein